MPRETGSPQVEKIVPLPKSMGKAPQRTERVRRETYVPKLESRANPDVVSQNAGDKTRTIKSRDRILADKERINKEEERLYNALARAVVSGEEASDAKDIAAVLSAQRDVIKELAAREPEKVGAVYRVMEDVSELYKSYESLADEAVRDSGLSGEPAAALREKLMGMRAELIGSTLDLRRRYPKSPESIGEMYDWTIREKARETKETIEENVREKEEELEEIELDEPEELDDIEVIDESPIDESPEASAFTERIKNRIKELEELEEHPGKDTYETINLLDKKITQDVRTWMKDYLADNPLVSDETALIAAESNGFGDFIWFSDIDNLRKEIRETKSALTIPSLERSFHRNLEAIYGKNERSPKELSNRPELAFTEEEDRFFARTLRVEKPKSTAKQTEPIPEPAVEPKKPKPGFMQRVASSFGKVGRGLALLFGMQAAEMRAPESEMSPRQEEVAPMAAEEERPSLKKASATRGRVESEPGAEAPKLAKGKRVEAPARAKVGRSARGENEPPVIDRLLEELDEAGLPSRSEYKRMGVEKKRQALEEARERYETMRELANRKSPLLDADKRVKLREKMEQYESFFRLVEEIRNAE